MSDRPADGAFLRALADAIDLTEEPSTINYRIARDRLRALAEVLDRFTPEVVAAAGEAMRCVSHRAGECKWTGNYAGVEEWNSVEARMAIIRKGLSDLLSAEESLSDGLDHSRDVILDRP